MVVRNSVLIHSASWAERKDIHLVIWYLGSGVEDQSLMKSKSNAFYQLLPYSIFQQLFWIHLRANQKARHGSKEKFSREEIQRKDSFQNL